MSEDIRISPVDREMILPFRDLYRQELGCQIVHDSAHYREKCFQSYAVRVGRDVVGYGSVWIGDFWMTKGSVFEFFVIALHRASLFSLFHEFLEVTKPPRI